MSQIETFLQSSEYKTLLANSLYDNCLIQSDYCANEVRWFDIISEDPDLLRTFVTAKKFKDVYRQTQDPTLKERAMLAGDIHKMTASEMYGIKPSEVTADQRDVMKTIVFGSMYGRTTGSIAGALKKTVQETYSLVEKFFKKFPRGEQWLTEIEEYAREHLYVESPIKRRRRLYNYLLNDENLEKRANRQARNSPIQGIASDANMLALAMFGNYLEDEGLDDRWVLRMTVHDSCIAQVPITDIWEYIKISESYFTEILPAYLNKIWGVKTDCPLEVDYEISQAPLHCWGNIVKWDFSDEGLIEIIRGTLVEKS